MGVVSYLALDGLRIGIVDDNPYSRRLMRTMLASFGIRQIYEAGTIVDGWEIVGKARPDVLLLDWSMRGGDGLMLLGRIRSHPDDALATQAVVFVSAYSGKRHVLTAVRYGANDFVVKPLSPRLLYDRLKRVVSLRPSYVRRDGRLVPVGAGAAGAGGAGAGAAPTVVPVREADAGDVAYL